MPKLVSSFSIVRNHKILSFLLLKVNDQKNMIIVLQCNTMKMCFVSTGLVWAFHFGPTIATSLKEMRNMQNL
jgi:hypothetical protein